MRVRRRSFDEGLAFARLVEALKARQWATAGRVVLQRPAALRHLGMPLAARLGRLGWRG